MFPTEFLDIPPLQGAAGTLPLPGSKSISNRVLLLAALSGGTTTVHDLLDSDDTRVMLDALRTLGCGVRHSGAAVEVTGLGGRAPASHARLFLGNAGTAMRPLAAALAVIGGEFELSGVARMHERPIGDLVDALRRLGCDIEYLGVAGYPPLRIGRPRLSLAAPIQVRGDVSSQFLTALLMALPLVARQDVVIEVVGALISKPYIEITLNLLARFGIAVRREGWQRFVIPAGSSYRSPGSIHVEADASSASYFIALGAIAAQPPRPVRIAGVGLDSIQGDIRFVEAARLMGADVRGGPGWLEVSRGAWPLKAIDLDCNHIPDAAMTLAIMALYADGPTTLRNIASWRVKETDRLAAMAAELRKLGASVDEGADFIQVTPPVDWKPASIATYDDHRIAMCFSLVSLGGCRVRINDPKCVNKTFPTYFERFGDVARPVPVVAIDGPSASGKGTVAARVAEALGYHYLDSGSLYRLVGLAAMRAAVALDDEPALAALAAGLPARFEGERVFLGTDDVTDAIRSEACSVGASRVAVMPAVRAALLDRQRDYRRAPGLVAEGRDMASVVFPDAGTKVFLTATAEARAQRRYKQLMEKGMAANMQSLLKDLQERDARDAARAVAPLRKLPDAALLDTTEMDVESAVGFVLGLLRC